MVKVALIIAFRDFRDEEYFIPREKLEEAGFEVLTASTSKGKALGKLGGEAESDLLIEDLDVSDYNAVLFIGGPGAHKLIENEQCRRIAREALKEEIVLGAICIAPAILARAGVLKRKKATVWSGAMDKSAVKILKEEGADYLPEPLVESDNVVTASGPDSAQAFAEKIIKKIQ